MKKILGLTLAGAMALSASAALAKDDNKVIVNGKEIASDYIVATDGDKMIPLRGVCEALGFEVKWEEEARKIEIVKLPVYITCSPDRDGYTFSKMAAQPLGKAPVLVDGTTYVPASFVTEILSGTIEDTDDIKITYGEEEKTAASVYATEINENSLTVTDFNFGEVIVNVSEETVIVDSEGKSVALGDIDLSKQLNITYSDAMTLSLPPMTTAVKIEVTNEMAMTVVDGTVSEIVKEDEKTVQFVLGEQKLALNVSDETVVKGIDGTEKTLADIKEGSSLKARTTGISTRSIPAQMSALEIIIAD